MKEGYKAITFHLYLHSLAKCKRKVTCPRHGGSYTTPARICAHSPSQCPRACASHCMPTTAHSTLLSKLTCNVCNLGMALLQSSSHSVLGHTAGASSMSICQSRLRISTRKLESLTADLPRSVQGEPHGPAQLILLC